MLEIGTPVKCLNCGMKWLRVTPNSNPGGIILNEDIQLYCPKCNSNWCQNLPETGVANV